MRVLMTGGYGCIGSWVARRWIDEGHEIWIFDRSCRVGYQKIIGWLPKPLD